MKKLSLVICGILIFTVQKSNSQCLPVNVSSTNVTQTTADIQLDNPTSGGTYYIEYGLAGFIPGTAGTAGTGGTLIAVPGQQISISQLTVHTTYHAYCRKNCTGTWSANSSVCIFTTAFDCSTAQPVSCSIMKNDNHIPGYGAWSNPCPTGLTKGTENVYSFTPMVSGSPVLLLPPNPTWTTYSYKAASGGCNSTGWTCIGNNFYSNNTHVTQWSFGPLTAGTTYYINADVQYPASGTPASLFRIECANCAQPTGVSASNILTNSANISWSGSGNIVEYGPPDFVPGTNLSAGGGTVVTLNSGNKLSGLTPSTTYDIYVRWNCGGGLYSPNSMKYSFTTLQCPPITAGTFGGLAYIFFTGPGIYNTQTTCNPPVLMGGAENVIRFTPPVSGICEVRISKSSSFNYQMSLTRNCRLDTAVCQYYYQSNVSQDIFLVGPLTAGIAYDLFIDVDASASGSITAYINCPVPLNVVTSNYQPYSTDITWSCNCSSVYLEYGPIGFTPGTGATAGTNGTLISNVTTPYTLAGLAADTRYDIYLRSNCAGNFSFNTAVTRIHTAQDCSTAPLVSCNDYLQFFVNASSYTNNGAWQSNVCPSTYNQSKEGIWRFIPSQTGDYSIFVYDYSGTISFQEVNFYYKPMSAGCNELNWNCAGKVSISAWNEVSLSLGTLTAGTTYLIMADGSQPYTFGNYTIYFRIDCPNLCEYPKLPSPIYSDIPNGVAIYTGCTSCFGNLILEYGLPGFTPGTGAAAGTNGTAVPASVFPYTINGLSPLTTYDIYARQDCGAGSYSLNSPKVSFTTICNKTPSSITSNAPGNTICSGASVTLTQNGGIPSSGGSLKWYTGSCGGTLAGTGTSITVSPTATTTYYVRAESSCGNSSCASLTITVNQLPPAAITPGSSTTFCSGGSVLLNANTGTGLTYQWKLNSVNISGATNSSYTATAGGGYTVVVTNSCGSATSSATTVIVNSLPSATITPASPTTFCSGGSVVLNAPTGTNKTYQWKKGANLVSGATLSSYTATTGGNYRVIVTNTATGCSKTTNSATIVTVNALPAATITPQGPTTFCAGGSVVLQANTGTGLTYKWKKGSNYISGATLSGYTATSGGNYRVQVTNSNGCSKTSALVTVSVPCKEGETFVSENNFDVKVFPNPSSGDFVFEILNVSTEKITISVYDMIGKLVLSENTFHSQFTIRNPQLTPGIYSAEIIYRENKKVVKLVKTN